MERLLLLLLFDSSRSILMVVPLVNISLERRFLSFDSSVLSFFNDRFRLGFSSFIFE